MTEGDGRTLSLFDATMLVVGGVIGVGIFFTPQAVAQRLPDAAPFFAAWIIGGVLAAAGALTFAELAATFPHAGGWYVYLREAFGRLPAFLFAWVVLLVVSTGAAAVIGDFCASQIEALVFPDGVSRALHLSLGAALIIGITGVALSGVKSGALLQNACTLLKLGALLAFLGGAFLVFEPAPPAAPAPPATWSLGNLALAMLPVMFAYGGWHIVTYLGHAIRDPQRNLPRSMLLGTGLVVLVYVLVNAAFVRVLGMDGLAHEPNFAALMARRTLGSVGGTLLIAAMAVSSLGVCTVILLGSPWVYVAMARDGLFFRSIGAVTPRTGAPANALLLQGAISLVLVWAASYARDGFQAMVDYTAPVFWIFFLLTGVTLFVFRARGGEPPAVRTPLYPLFPVVFCGMCAYMIYSTVSYALADYGPKFGNMVLTGIVVMLAGIPLYLLARRK